MVEAPQSKKTVTIIVVAVIIIAIIGAAVTYFYIYPKFFGDDDDDDDDDENKTVKNRRPFAKIRVYYEGMFPAAGSTIWFNGSESQDPNGDALTYSWDFDDSEDLDGDGNYKNDKQRTGVNVSWVYPTNGTYLVTLTVNDTELEDTGTYVLVVRIATNDEYPIVLMTCTGKKEGLTGTLYLVSVAQVEPLFLSKNYTVRIYDIEEDNTTKVYEAGVGNLTTGVVYRDLDGDGLLSQGDIFQVSPSEEMPVDDGDLFLLVYREMEVGVVAFESLGL